MSSPALSPHPSALFLLQILGSGFPGLLLSCHLSPFDLECLCQLTEEQGPCLIPPYTSVVSFTGHMHSRQPVPSSQVNQFNHTV